MFILLLAATFLIALVVSFIVVRVFSNSIDNILKRIISDEISGAWLKYIKFAIYVVGISNGVRIHQLERYITAVRSDDEILQLTMERWVIEVYRTIIGTLGGIAWMLLVFFVFALIAYVIVRVFEFKRKNETHVEE
ncbi:MAG: hypothetical protein JXB48_16530 [Candidatus Latescibacteria bacterium]|nr:hypothetical protein [Candidatus Latescibacterota bacterium]